jgi:hypothetical protein
LLKLLGAPRDVLELRVAIRVLSPFARFAIGLQAVAHVLQHLADSLMAHSMALTRQLGSQRAHALAGPAQRRHRVASRRRLHQLFQCRAQPRVGVRHPRPTRAFTPHAMLRRKHHEFSRVTQLLHPRRDRRTRQADRPRNSADTAVPERTSFCRRPQPAHLLVHHAAQRLVLLSYLGLVIIHPAMLTARIQLVKVIC